MNPATRRKIAVFTETIRETLEIGCPVDVQGVVANLGGRVRESTELPPHIEARISRTGQTFEIVLNPEKSPTRRKFSIAHELGHLFMHMGYVTDPEKWAKSASYDDSGYTRFGYGAEEQEANEFAAALLMPEGEFKAAVLENHVDGRVQLDRVAKRFGVSKEAARIRGIVLGLVQQR